MKTGQGPQVGRVKLESVYVLVREWWLDMSSEPLGWKTSMCFCMNKILVHRFLFSFFTMALMIGGARKVL